MELYDINRVALIISPSEALLRWAISEVPSLANDVDPEDTADLCTVYLLPDFTNDDDAEDWLEDNFIVLLESLLEDWIPDESLWPERLEFDHFEKYADYTFSSAVIDTTEEGYDEDDDDDEG